MSIGRRGPWLSVNTRGAKAIAASPTGTLIQKIQCQEIPPTIAPPTTGPTATAEPVTAPQIPIALPRWPAGEAADTSARLSGVISAAPAPWIARAAISAPEDGARAHAADAEVNSASPTVNIRRRPRRSPSTAPSRISTPKLST